jgi:hypothetical protein
VTLEKGVLDGVRPGEGIVAGIAYSILLSMARKERIIVAI